MQNTFRFHLSDFKIKCDYASNYDRSINTPVPNSYRALH